MNNTDKPSDKQSTPEALFAVWWEKWGVIYSTTEGASKKSFLAGYSEGHQQGFKEGFKAGAEHGKSSIMES